MIEITKQDLEGMVPVLTFPTDELADKVLSQVPAAYIALRDNLLSTSGEATMSQRQALLLQVKKLVCLDALISIFSQMDLVATPTGFGVVSNQDTAPASSARVNALKDEVLTLRLHTADSVIDLLAQVPGWGDTLQALRAVSVAFRKILYLQTYCGMSGYTHKDWQAAQPAILEADAIMRRNISDAQMDCVLNAIRHSEASAYTPLIQHMHFFTAAFILKNVPLQRTTLRRLVQEVEDPLKGRNLYKPYVDSDAYKANHYEHRRNRKEEAGFVFGR